MTPDQQIRRAWDAKTRSGGSGPARATVRRLRRNLGDNGSISRYFFRLNPPKEWGLKVS